ncbi:MAG: hypothetical protein IKJ99_02905 [Oscillospiraceae bacterium]|nr:hypothetical protein [Oscillospiraceae bacterium]
MATEKRMISLAEAIAKVKDDGLLGDGYSDDERIDDVCDILESCEIVDAVEVVRCETCRYRSQYSDKNGMYHCGGIETAKDHVLPVVAPDFFCAYGERRC